MFYQWGPTGGDSISPFFVGGYATRLVERHLDDEILEVKERLRRSYSKLKRHMRRRSMLGVELGLETTTRSVWWQQTNTCRGVLSRSLSGLTTAEIFFQDSQEIAQRNECVIFWRLHRSAGVSHNE